MFCYDMFRYKCKADDEKDIELVRVLLPDACFDVRPLRGALSGVEVTIGTYVPLTALRDIIGLIPNGQLMLETLAQEDVYTGRRRASGFSERNN